MSKTSPLCFSDITTTSESSPSSSDESEDDELKTPKKRRYKRTLHHGASAKRAAYHKITPEKYRKYKEKNSLGTNLCSETENAHISENVVIYSDAHYTCTSDSSNDCKSQSCSTTNSDSDACMFDMEQVLASSGFSSETTPVTTETDEDSTSEHSQSDHEDSYTENEKDFDKPLYDGCKISKKTSYTLIMMCVMKFGMPKEGFSFLLRIISAHLPAGCDYSTSVYMTKEILKKCVNFKEPVLHKYCEQCQQLLSEGKPCNNEACQKQKASLMEFSDLRLEDQLQSMFKDANFYDAVYARQQVTRNGERDYSDILKADKHREISPQENGADINITLTMNTDGVSLFSSSKKGSLWPVYVAVNELPVKLRFSRKYLIPWFLHCQVEKPNMMTYLTPMMHTLNHLYETGIRVASPTGKIILVKVQLIAASVDLPAKAIVANMKQFNGKYGCSRCYDEGESPIGNPMLRFYPFNDNCVLRTHESMVQDARDALRTGTAVNGVKGVSSLMILKYIDQPRVFVIDWMHCVLLGVTKALMVFWFNSKHKDEDFFIGDKTELLNRRFLKIKIPDFISRRQRSLQDHAHWKASEFREWLMHFSAPLLYGVMKPTPYMHYLLLVTGMSLLVKDDLNNVDIDKAEMLLLDFCRIYPDIYGKKAQTMNIHLLRHLPEFARLYGPLFEYSCFGFESMNNYLKNMVHGTRYVTSQVSFAVGMSKQLDELVKQILEISDPCTKQLISDLSSKLILKDMPDDGGYSILGRKKNVNATHMIFDMLPDELRQANVKSFSRLKCSNTTFYSKVYQSAKTRNDTVFTYEDHNEGTKFGMIDQFIQVNNEKFVIMQECYTGRITLKQTMKQSIKHRDLVKHFDTSFIPHIVKVTSLSEKKLLSVKNIRKKCVLIEVSANNLFISCPPNTLEHN